MLRSISICFAALLFSFPACAGTMYCELSDGELSFDSTDPTDLGVFTRGANIVDGQVTAIGMGGFNETADVFTFEIAAGTHLDSIILTDFFTVSGAAVFLGLDDGEQFGFTAEEINNEFFLPDLTQILGASVVGNVNRGTDILDDLQNAVNLGNGSAFTTPLGPGHYSVYIQETGPQSDYKLQFNVSSVPEPASVTAFAFILFGAGLSQTRRRRRQNVKPTTP